MLVNPNCQLPYFMRLQIGFPIFCKNQSTSNIKLPKIWQRCAGLVLNQNKSNIFSSCRSHCKIAKTRVMTWWACFYFILPDSAFALTSISVVRIDTNVCSRLDFLFGGVILVAEVLVWGFRVTLTFIAWFTIACTWTLRVAHLAPILTNILLINYNKTDS